jgi:hypothetical protein
VDNRYFILWLVALTYTLDTADPHTVTFQSNTLFLTLSRQDTVTFADEDTNAEIRVATPEGLSHRIELAATTALLTTVGNEENELNSTAATSFFITSTVIELAKRDHLVHD